MWVRSCEQPVEIPVCGHRLAILVGKLALVEPVAEDPEAAALLVLDAEIVAGQCVATLLPPFHGDALGAFDPHYRMGDATPGEMMRRTVGNGRERHLDGLGLFEQPERPQRRLAFATHGPG